MTAKLGICPICNRLGFLTGNVCSACADIPPETDSYTVMFFHSIEDVRAFLKEQFGSPCLWDDNNTLKDTQKHNPKKDMR